MTTPMKAIVVRQPWATLIALGVKTNPEAARFWAKVSLRGDDECWEWQASRQTRGHGLFRVGSRKDGSTRLVKAHRYAYEALVGPIPDGLALDHLCSNPPCVNPSHLDPCTRGENVRREAVRRSTCRRGHPWQPVDVGGNRTCATCLVATRARANEARRLRRANGSGE